MSEIFTLAAQCRDRLGRGAARELRRNGRVPAVIYSADTEPQHVSVETKALTRRIKRGRFLSTLLNVEFEGELVRAIPKECQLDPVFDHPVHLDLLRVSSGSTLQIDVPVRFEDHEESPGLKRGGVLNIVRHTIELNCPVDSIPEVLTVCLSGLEIGASIHISAIDLPDGVSPVIQDRDFTVATIAAPTVESETVDAEVEEEEIDEDEQTEED